MGTGKKVCVARDVLLCIKVWLGTQKVTPRGGRFFVLWLIQTLFVVKYPLLNLGCTMGKAPNQGLL